MIRSKSLAIVWACLLAGLWFAQGGCQGQGDVIGSLKTDKWRFLSPHQVVAPPKGTPISPILTNLSPADTSTEIPPNATWPRRDDYLADKSEYIIGPADVLDISILDLYAEGLETVVRREVSDGGYIDLPQIDERVRAEGLSKAELKQAIIEGYSPNILRDPTISVTLVARRQSVFSIFGQVDRAGTFNITRPDMRLMEALAMAGELSQNLTPYIYVFRHSTAEVAEPTTNWRGGGTPDEVVLPPMPEEDGAAVPEMPPMPESPEMPQAPDDGGPAGEGDNGGSADGLQDSLDELGESLDANPTDIPRLAEVSDAPTGAASDQTPAETTAGSNQAAVKWIYSEGKWKAVPMEGAETGDETGRAAEPDRPLGIPEMVKTSIASDPNDVFRWSQVDKTKLARVIAIDFNKLKQGDPRMNVVIRDNDVVYVPRLEIGEFYVFGEVRSPGVYSLTGRRMTVKQAIAAAGNLGPFAWPENAVLYRRVGANEEQMIPIDIEAIFQGRQPDFLLKKDDLIAVGTSIQSTFYAVIRNAFRMTYGFGFIYDRNFANPIFTTPTSRRFSRW